MMKNKSCNKIIVKSHKITKTIETLKEYKNFDMLLTIIACDLMDKFQLNYKLYSSSFKKILDVVTFIDKRSSYINTVSNIFASANYDEREIYDLFGIIFINHPNLKRILLSDSWISHPLLKDYDQKKDIRLSYNYGK